MALIDHVLSDETLLAAWQRVRENDGAPGTDGVTLNDFGRELTTRLGQLRAQVREARYAPQPLLRIPIERPGKSPRLLAVPSVRDRVLQTAAALVLNPILEPHFEDASFAYRPGRSVAQAVQRLIDGRNSGLRWVVDADISAYFDNIPHQALLERLIPMMPDQTLLPLIRSWLTTPVKTPAGCEKRPLGVPQGSPISPLFANLFLDPFDEMVAERDRWLVRYADDFVILCRTQDEAEQALEDAGRWLQAVGLALNFDKTRITRFDTGFEFLGVRFEGDQQWAADPEAAPWVLPRHLRPPASARPATKPPSQRVRLVASRGAAAPERPDPQTSCPQAGYEFDPDAPPLLRTLYLAEPGAYLHREGERLLVSKDGDELVSIPIEKVDQVLAANEGAISFGALRYLMRKNISLLVLDAAGEPMGAFVNLLAGHVALRRQQFERAADAAFRRAAASAIVAAKIANSRLMLRRYFRVRADKSNIHDESLAELQRKVAHAESLDAVRGHEGAAARHYFDGLRELLAPGWKFDGRNRQPPRDPVNALLSYGYGVLYHNLLTLIGRRGLDPHIGSLHAEREGHAALASDLMEEFRPLIVDAVVLKLLLGGKVAGRDFDYGHADYPIRLSANLRKRFMAEIEGKLGSALTYPRLGKLMDYRRAMLHQIAHWADHVQGHVDRYQALVLR